MNLFFMIIIQNPLPFYHGCLFGSIKPDTTARFFGYLYCVYFQFFIYFCESVFLEIIIQNEV